MGLICVCVEVCCVCWGRFWGVFSLGFLGLYYSLALLDLYYSSAFFRLYYYISYSVTPQTPRSGFTLRRIWGVFFVGVFLVFGFFGCVSAPCVCFAPCFPHRWYWCLGIRLSDLHVCGFARLLPLTEYLHEG